MNIIQLRIYIILKMSFVPVVFLTSVCIMLYFDRANIDKYLLKNNKYTVNFAKLDKEFN